MPLGDVVIFVAVTWHSMHGATQARRRSAASGSMATNMAAPSNLRNSAVYVLVYVILRSLARVRTIIFENASTEVDRRLNDFRRANRKIQ